MVHIGICTLYWLVTSFLASILRLWTPFVSTLSWPRKRAGRPGLMGVLVMINLPYVDTHIWLHWHTRNCPITENLRSSDSHYPGDFLIHLVGASSIRQIKVDQCRPSRRFRSSGRGSSFNTGRLIFLPEKLFDQLHKLCHRLFFLLVVLPIPNRLQHRHGIFVPLLRCPSLFSILPVPAASSSTPSSTS